MQITLSLALAALLAAADPALPAAFTVTSEVSVAADRLYPIGFMNFCEPMGAMKTHQNTVFREVSCEVPTQHWFGLVNEVQDGGAVVRLDGLLQSRVAGSCNGVQARIYRIVDAAGQPLPLSPEKTYNGPYLDLAKADRVVCVGRREVADYVIESPKKPFRSAYHFKPGPEIRQWDAVFLEVDRPEIDDTTDGLAWNPVTKDDPSPIAIVPHAVPAPTGIDLGRSCLAFTPGAGEHGIKQVVFGGTGQSWYSQLYPGQKYRLDVWMRQDGLGNGGSVRFGMAGRMYPEVKTTFTVTGAWQRFTYDFTGPPLPETKAQPDGPAFYATGPGTLWIDQPRIVAYDDASELDKPFVPDRRLLAAMLASQRTDGAKGFLRTWAAMTSRSMDQLLSWHAPCGGGFRRSETIPVALAYCEATGTTPATRMRPWLTVNVWHTEDDWRALIEYLAAPYDAAKDTPKSKPWAWRRVQQRGHARPWSEDFDRINLELGNENWHNRVNLEWVGFGRAGMVHGDGLQYGMWGKYLYQEVLATSPFWKPAGLDRKILWNMAGGYGGGLDKEGRPSGYGPDSMRGAWPTSTMSSMALYVGPRWELGEKSVETIDDDTVQRTLVAYQTGVRDKVLNTDAARAKLAEAGIRYELFSYEGGPGGYGKEATPTVIRLGHSLALGLAAVEAWLDTYHHGWVGHCLYASNQGDAWSNHSLFSRGLHGTPAWQGLTMINQHLQRGDLLRTEATVPTLDLAVLDKDGKPVKDKKTKQPMQQTVQLARCFAFRDGQRLAIGLLNLKTPGRHSGVDLGDGSTPATVRVPVTAAQRITCIRMAGSALDGNDDSLRVHPVTTEVPRSALVNGTLDVGRLPPCSFSIYIIE